MLLLPVNSQPRIARECTTAAGLAFRTAANRVGSLWLRGADGPLLSVRCCCWTRVSAGPPAAHYSLYQTAAMLCTLCPAASCARCARHPSRARSKRHALAHVTHPRGKGRCR